MLHDSSSEPVHRFLEELLLVYRLGDARSDTRGEDCIGTQSVVTNERLVELCQARVDLSGVGIRGYRVKEKSAGHCIHIGSIESRDREVGRRSVSGLGNGVEESVERLEARIMRRAEAEAEDIHLGKGGWHGR